MEPKWELLDLIMAIELKYADFMELLRENEEVDMALSDPAAVVAPALALGYLMGELMKVFGLTVDEFNKRAKEAGGKTIKVMDDELFKTWPHRI